METRELASPASNTGSAARNNRWLGALIETMDRRLRYRLGVNEYTRSPACILRMQIIRNTDDVLLKDGTRLRPGDRIIDLHFWNQQVPLILEEGPTLGWAHRMSTGFKQSLQELAYHLAARRDLDDVKAIRVVAALGADARQDKIARILSRFGFETVVPREAPSVTRQIRRLGENILISLMVLAYNAIALHPDTLRRGRVPAYLSRRILDERYGAAEKKLSASRESWLVLDSSVSRGPPCGDMLPNQT